jgi:hypothetical protein
MRFLITPTEYLSLNNAPTARMAQALGRALTRLGHEAEAATRPLSGAEAVRACADQRVDVLMQINCLAPPGLPRHVRHIAWFQDVFPDTASSGSSQVRDTDLVYFLGDRSTLGFKTELACFCGSLFPGVDAEAATQADAASQDLDFSLCGFIPAPLPRRGSLARLAIALGNLLLDLAGERVQRIDFPIPVGLFEDLASIVRRHYQPLHGELDIQGIADDMKRRAARWLGLPPHRRRQRNVGRYIDFLSREYPRLLDRQTLLSKALSISTSLAFFGPGGETHSWLRPYYRGVLTAPEQLLDVYRRTRLNLANNTHGLGLHGRTLDCMAVGGFVFMHDSPNANRPGGMLTAFEPGVHFGQYTAATFEEEARRWLRQQNERMAVGARAAAEVRARHNWEQRARQLLDDLAR